MKLLNETFGRQTIPTALIAGLFLFCLPVADAQTDADGSHYVPMMRYLLRVDGQAAPEVKFFISGRGDSFLLVSPSLPAPVLLHLPTAEVKTVHGSELVEREDGSLEIPQEATLTLQGQFAMENDAPTFKLGEHNVRIELPPPLLGLKDVADLHAYNPEYGQRSAAYQPDSASLSRLKAERKPLRLRVYFGSWCPHCNRTLPHLMKVMEAIEGSPFQIEYYGLPEEYRKGPESTEMKIDALPTAIVYRQDEEIGRITGDQWTSPEKTLSALLDDNEP